MSTYNKYCHSQVKNIASGTHNSDDKGYGSHILPSRLGSYYEDTVPDTLDLSEHARFGINHFTGIIREDLNYEMPFFGEFLQYREMNAHVTALGACQAKAMEAMAFLRVMSGSTQNVELEAKMVEMMGSLLGEDGLHWIPANDNGKKPWLKNEPLVMVSGQALMIRAMMAWYQYTGDKNWKLRIDKMVDALDHVIVVHKGDYAYFPISGFFDQEYLRSCFTKRGWKNVDEPVNEKAGEEGSLFNHQGHTPGVLANWYGLTGNKQALRLAGELVRFYTKPKFWADWEKGEYPEVSGADHAHFQGHFHGHINTLRSIFEYATVTNDIRLKAFVRDGYEWARQIVFSRIGYFDGQGCACGRMIALAVKMSYAGIGDYWEDVDQYIRNHGTEMQITPDDIPYLTDIAEKKPPGVGHEWIIRDGPINVPLNELVDSSIGTYPMNEDKGIYGLCCSSHGNMGLFYAWDGILRYFNRTVQVNLLLNRASPWMDIYSYLPYEGKVVLKNKAAEKVYVRIPLWVDKKTVECRLNERKVSLIWFGNYIVLENLKPEDNIIVEFAVEERLEKWTMSELKLNNWKNQGYDDNTYNCRFKGNTLIEITPGLYPESPLYKKRPQQFNALKAPLKQVTRFATNFTFKW